MPQSMHARSVRDDIVYFVDWDVVVVYEVKLVPVVVDCGRNSTVVVVVW